MKVGLVGFSGAGKTSVFNSLTGQSAETGAGKKGALNRGQIDVPDARVDALSAIYEPKKITYAKIWFVDAAGPGDQERGNSSGLDPSLAGLLRESEALVHVVRGFENPMLTAAPDAARDVGAFDDELILTDLVQVEKRLERLKKEGQAKGAEAELMHKLAEALESGTALRRLDLAKEELAQLTGFQFLSLKPVLVVVNQAEDDAGQPLPDAVLEALKARAVDGIGMCATLEAEIMAMEPADQAAFLADLGLSDSARARFIQAAYGLVDLISFLTAGKDEVRAWTIRRGTRAKEAAGKIHSDIERGFIRAEVTPYADFIALGSEAKVKEAGKMRLEGKEYVVQDGDIVHFRHSG